MSRPSFNNYSSSLIQSNNSKTSNRYWCSNKNSNNSSKCKWTKTHTNRRWRWTTGRCRCQRCQTWTLTCRICITWATCRTIRWTPLWIWGTCPIWIWCTTIWWICHRWIPSNSKWCSQIKWTWWEINTNNKTNTTWSFFFLISFNN